MMRNPMRAMDQSVSACHKRAALAASLCGTAGFLAVLLFGWLIWLELGTAFLPWWVWLVGGICTGAAISSGVQQAGDRRAAVKGLRNFMEQSRRPPGEPRP